MGTRTVCIDAHVHTDASHDSTAAPAAVLDRAREVDLDGVVVTDHDTTAGARRAVELAGEDLLVVPGVEVSTADGHLLAIGIERRPEPGRPIDETVAAVRAAGGVAVVAHPFQVSRHGVRRRTLRRCDPDGIEVYNAHLMTGYRNGRARRYARRAGYPGLAGSDAHVPSLVGRAYTELAVETDADRPGEIPTAAVLDAIRAGRVRAVGRPAPMGLLVGRLARTASRKVTAALVSTGSTVR